MQHRMSIWYILIAIGVSGAGLRRVHAADPDRPGAEIPASSAPRVRKAVERGLEFLVQDAVDWRTERKCATCHHGAMTVWALSEAKDRGFAIPGDRLADQSNWLKERFKDLDKPRDPRPGWNMVSTPAVYMAVMAEALPAQNAISPDDLNRIAGHLLRHQESDGSWAWSPAPAKNRPPPVFESDEVVTLLADLALRPRVPVDPSVKSEAREGRQHASSWLAKNTPNGTTQGQAIRIFREFRAGKSSEDLAPAISRLLGEQNDDGGWGQNKDLPSDAFATGQALYFLSVAGVKADRPEIRRAASFLVGSQKEDGSWPMTPRSHPGVTPSTNLVPITYFGSAWATMGLLRTVPK